MNKARTVLAFTIGPVLVVGLASGCGSASEGPPPASSSSSASAAGQSGPTLDQAADVIAATYQALVNLVCHGCGTPMSRQLHAPNCRQPRWRRSRRRKLSCPVSPRRPGPAVKPGQARYAATLTFTGEGDGRRWRDAGSFFNTPTAGLSSQPADWSPWYKPCPHMRNQPRKAM